MHFDFDLMDVYKALIALGAGVILGMERELKDKSAGLKTISVITLGSALFAILSLRMGSPGEYTRIASYIVAGIGFLGAGVIFRDNVSVTGLTTAAVIWLASAVGMAIGFGQITLAFVFLFTSLLIIHFPQTISRFFHGGRVSRMIIITMRRDKAGARTQVIDDISKYLVKCDEKRIKLSEDQITIYLDATVKKELLPILENHLLSDKRVEYFEF